MLHLFLQQVPANVDAMVAAFEQGDLEQMGALAHRIKPTLDNLAIEEVREVIREIELAGKTGEKTERLNDQIAQVKEVISSVATLMQQDIDRFSQS
jgi:HPt (histidine-containing phosphotransfer) domain-containing protein